MKTKHFSRLAAPLVLLAAAFPAAAAERFAPDGWYLGGNLGQSMATIERQRIANELAAQGLGLAAFRKDTRDLGFKAFGGYQFNRNFALEAGYFDLGEFDYTATTQPTGSLNGEAKFRGVNLDAVGILPLGERFSAFARAGVTYAESEAAFSGTGAVRVTDAQRSEKKTNYKVGVGLEYAVTQRVGLRAELERYRLKDSVGNTGDVDLASLGLVYRFGAPRIVAAVVAPAVQAAPPAASAPPPPPLLPAARSLRLSADSQFDFDRAIVKPEGQRELNQFANDLKGSSYGLITVTGHTDYLGSEAYNQALSIQRAEAVKQYLIEAAAIPAEKIEALGKGESSPLTAPGECERQFGAAVSLELIACLQPDRRVDVEVVAPQ